MSIATELGQSTLSSCSQGPSNMEISMVKLPSKNSPEYDELFPLVRVEDISPNDRFINGYIPTSANQRRVKRSIMMAISPHSHMMNFRRAAVLPRFTKAADGKLMVSFNEEDRPAVGMTPEWWEEFARNVSKNNRSRLGTDYEYDVFLGTIIKDLVENKGYGIREAWKITCDSQLIASNLGKHSKKRYKRARHAKGKIYDAEKIRFILKGHSENCFYIVGNYSEGRDIRYTASMFEAQYKNTVYLRSEGWIVLDK